MPKGDTSNKESTSKNQASESSATPASTNEGSAAADGSVNKKLNRLSWRGGSWRGKASAVAEIAKESIPGSTASVTATNPSHSSRRSSHRLSQNLGSPGKSKASPASATPLTVNSDASSDDRAERSSEKEQKKDPEAANGDEKYGQAAPAVTSKDGSAETKPGEDQLQQTSVWRGWWSRGTQEKDQQNQATPGDTTSAIPATEPPSGNKAPEQAIPSPTVKTDSNTISPQEGPWQDRASTETQTSPRPQRNSWFGLWGSGKAPEQSTLTVQRRPSGPKGLSVEPSATNVEANPEPSNNASATGETVKSQLTSRPASGSWAFWSRERPSDGNSTASQKSEQKGEVGELAVSGTESQSKPRPAQLSEKDDTSSPEASKKRQRPESSELSPSASKKKAAGKQAAAVADETPASHSDSEVPPPMQQSVLRTTIQPPKSKARTTPKEKVKPAVPPPNAIFPPFNASYPLAQSGSYLTRLSRYIPYVPSNAPTRHLNRSPTPHRIRRALAIGVHGYFPAALIQKLLGPPTGTSIKFADSAAAAIQQHCSLHAYTADIEKVALEGEGTVEQRIESLWKLLLNWIDAIRKSDLILVACHSQGVPVAVGLVARLLSFGCVQSHARIGVCAMAGVSQGPFPSYQSRFLPVGSSAAELFQFAQPSSAVSQSYTNNLNTCLRHHVRILYVGSLDDQLVSLESSTFSLVNHPYISRAVFVDGREHPTTGDFVTHLVGFGLKLRNLGVSDHGLIRELSSPLAGSLYTGEGHSRIYEEEAVYDLAVRLAVETEPLDQHTNPHLEVNRTDGETNPFFLPWAVRGVLEEDVVKREMRSETDELLGLFEKWRPQSKTLKDVRFRLEAVRSKL